MLRGSRQIFLRDDGRAHLSNRNISVNETDFNESTDRSEGRFVVTVSQVSAGQG